MTLDVHVVSQYLGPAMVKKEHKQEYFSQPSILLTLAGYNKIM